MTKTKIDPSTFTLSDPEHQNYLLDLFFDNFYTVSWDSLDQLEYAMKEVLSRRKIQTDDNSHANHSSISNTMDGMMGGEGMYPAGYNHLSQDQNYNRNDNAPPSVNNFNMNEFGGQGHFQQSGGANRINALSPHELKSIKEGIDSFMETTVEPELKKCMDVFEMVVVEEVLPKIDSTAGKQTDFDKFLEESNLLLNPTTKITPENIDQQKSLKAITQAKEIFKANIQILKFLQQQESIMKQYQDQIQKINQDLQDGTTSVLESIELLNNKRRELNQVYIDLSECFDRNPSEDLMELMEEGNTIQVKSTPSQEY